ncbi:MAG: hypothetical protein CMK09_02455 [Ponticaulis sp.]|nr:hypothetical protein [Ponticaulis sp.]|tara:strand:- start:15595 stop:15885 length:291 start_codon:yes stop_codon:yes gene_type:complete
MTFKLTLGLCALVGLAACETHGGQIYIGVAPDEIERQLAEGQVCRTERPTGSNLPQRICATEEEWAEFDAEAERNAQEIMDRIGAGDPEFDGGYTE